MWEGDDNGFYARLETDTSTPEHEQYVLIKNRNHNPTDPASTLLELVGVTDAQIQASPTYKAVATLFDNYHLNAGNESATVKSSEIESFLDEILKTNVLKIAQKYIVEQLKQADLADPANWRKALKEIVFHGAPKANAQSLFEHVFVGDPDGRKLGGHHFWYKFYLEDKGLLKINGRAIPRSEIIVNHVIKAKREVVTLQYSLEADDQDFFKKTGGWFVGLSPEGLVAFGLVAFFGSKKKSRTLPIQVDGVNIKLQLYAPGQNGNPFRTFYPMI
jgi:poly(U)-specific endoribonuclease